MLSLAPPFDPAGVLKQAPGRGGQGVLMLAPLASKDTWSLADVRVHVRLGIWGKADVIKQLFLLD